MLRKKYLRFYCYAVLMYAYYFCSFHPVYHGPSHVHKMNRLSELTEYEFRIYASNEAGDGPYSENCKFSTTKAPPPAVKRE